MNQDLQQQKEQRKTICQTCEKRQTLLSMVDICSICKCPIFKVVKKSCPINKW